MAFPFVQFEFGFLLGPPDGRYLRRENVDSEPERVLVLRTLGAPQRRLIGGRRPRAAKDGDAAAVPTSRATVVRVRDLDDPDAWLDALRQDGDRLDEELGRAEREVNLALRAHRVAAVDPSVQDVGSLRALVVRVGYGSGEDVADGHWARAYEVPPDRRKLKRRELLAPQERFAAILGGREPLPAGEELLLRARADLDAGRPREAALQTRVALEALAADGLDGVGELRPAVGDAANAALAGELDAEQAGQLDDAVERLERAVRRRSLQRIQD